MIRYFLKIFLIFIFLSLAFAQSIFARPPSAIEMSYDKDQKVLHIVIKHVSDNLPEHRIRKIVVSKNDEELNTFYYATQTHPSGQVQDVSVIAKPGDVFKGLAICREAGRKEETFTVPEDELENEGKDKEHSASQKPSPKEPSPAKEESVPQKEKSMYP